MSAEQTRRIGLTVGKGELKGAEEKGVYEGSLTKSERGRKSPLMGQDTDL